MLCRGFLGYGPFSSYNQGGMFIMMGFGFLIFLVLIFLAFKLIKANSASAFSLSSNQALEILNHRYAKGEISDEEYAQKKINLTKKN